MSDTQKSETAKRAASGQKSATAAREEEILAFWNENDIFNKSVQKDAPKGDYVFYDGPPFATGTPHYGHLVASAIKDAIPRYFTMRGFRVERQWGWDCHGLPIENIVEKELGTKSKKDIEALGVKKFNELCREKIFTYVDLWNKFIPRFGRWADMENPYRTMDKDYMESEWWAFKKLYDNGLIYEDYRSMHICPRCETTLAQSEVAEGYRDVKDLAVTVKFPLKGEPNTYLLAWTTTPWTLPGNISLAVGVNVDYVKAGHEGEYYIVAKELVKKIFNEKEYVVIGEMKGSELVGKEYLPPFDDYLNADLPNKENAWKVYAADFVTTETGTGIAHEAPAFGAEDMELAQKENLPMIQHVGMDGIIKPEVKELRGRSVKPIDDPQATDIEVIKLLAKKGLLFAKEKYEHSYPHCWRCDTPLINYATSSWFVAVQRIKDTLLKTAKEINWSPAHVKEGRWGEWLKGARDWSISRQRFWANTIPVWRCNGTASSIERRASSAANGCGNEIVFGSIEELQEVSGAEVTDLHKDIVDDVVFACDKCDGKMRRVPDVLDTWFDSGSVPFATYHYPFEHADKVRERVPADFIAEGQDQVSKWFYYQHVLSGGLFEKPAFKNVVVNGIVLAEDGKKMSKRLQNYPDPAEVVDKYGADAVRLYLLSSPVVRAENLNFAEDGVAQVSSKVIGRLANVYAFYELYKNEIEHTPNDRSTHALDRWIVARVSEVHAEVTKAMNAYELDRAVRPLMEFVDDLSTWYLRRSRERLKGDDELDKKAALATTRWVLREYAKMAAPFAPFIADWLWQNLKREGDAESVHLAEWSETKKEDENILIEMAKAREITSLSLEQRAKAGIKVRQPLRKIAIDIEVSDEMAELIKDEINVKEIVTKGDAYAKKFTVPSVTLDTTITPELQEEGEVRGLIRAIQDARKSAGLTPGDVVDIRITGPKSVHVLAEKFASDIKKQTHTGAISFEEGSDVSVAVGK
jgi:isoleucyl-tRNA synthetase